MAAARINEDNFNIVNAFFKRSGKLAAGKGKCYSGNPVADTPLNLCANIVVGRTLSVCFDLKL